MLIYRGQYQLKLCECWFINSRDTIVIKCYLRIINHSEIGVMFTNETRFRLGASLCDTLSKKKKITQKNTLDIYIYMYVCILYMYIYIYVYYHWKFMLDSWLFSSNLLKPGPICHGLTQLGHGVSRGKTHLPMPIQQALAAS